MAYGIGIILSISYISACVEPTVAPYQVLNKRRVIATDIRTFP